MKSCLRNAYIMDIEIGLEKILQLFLREALQQKNWKFYTFLTVNMWMNRMLESLCLTALQMRFLQCCFEVNLLVWWLFIGSITSLKSSSYINNKTQAFSQKDFSVSKEILSFFILVGIREHDKFFVCMKIDSLFPHNRNNSPCLSVLVCLSQMHFYCVINSQ